MFINRLKLMLSYLRKRPKVNGLPVEIGIEITTACNMDCSMCPRQDAIESGKRTLGFMNRNLFKKIINEIKDFAEIIYLHGLGEPILHPEFFDFLRLAKKAKLHVGISTNGMTLDRETAEKILMSNLDYLIFGLDAVKPETYQKVRKGGDFEKVKENIENFLKLKKEKRLKNPFVVIQFIEQETNRGEVKEFLNYWQKKEADVIRIKPVIALKKEDKKKVEKKEKFRPCFHVFRQLNIFWDGTVVPCCEDCYGDYPLGNVRDKSLKEIWNSQKMETLRRATLFSQREKTPLCKNCSYPQPTTLQAIGVLAINHLTVKKLLPRIETLFRKRSKILYD